MSISYTKPARKEGPIEMKLCVQGKQWWTVGVKEGEVSENKTTDSSAISATHWNDDWESVARCFAGIKGSRDEEILRRRDT